MVTRWRAARNATSRYRSASKWPMTTRSATPSVPESRLDRARTVPGDVVLQIVERDRVRLAGDDPFGFRVEGDREAEVSNPREEIDNGLPGTRNASHSDTLADIPRGKHHLTHVEPEPHTVLAKDGLRPAAPQPADLRHPPGPVDPREVLDDRPGSKDLCIDRGEGILPWGQVSWEDEDQDIADPTPSTR